jgi:hypothetical protein
VYEVDSGHQVYQTRCSYPNLWALAYSKTGNRPLISSGTKHERLIIADASTGRELLQLPYGNCFNLAYSPANDCLATFGHLGMVRLFHSANGSQNSKEQRKASKSISVVRRQRVPGDLKATIENIRADESLSSIEKKSACALAKFWIESPHDLQWKAREILMKRTRGSSEDALRLAEAASRVVPDCPECSTTFGLALFQAGRKELAQSVLEAAVPNLRLEHLHDDEARRLLGLKHGLSSLLPSIIAWAGNSQS